MEYIDDRNFRHMKTVCEIFEMENKGDTRIFTFKAIKFCLLLYLKTFGQSHIEYMN